MKFMLHVKSPHRLDQPYIYDNLQGTFSGQFFRNAGMATHPPIPAPRLEIVLGHSCNGSCLYCDQANIRGNYSSTGGQDSGNIARFIAKLKELLDRDMPAEHLEGVLWGGEGLLYIDAIKRICSGFEGFRKTRWIIPTNARLLRGDVFAWIMRQSNIYVQVSHDGQSTHEFRGYDPFDDSEVFQNLRALQAEGRIIFNPVLHGRTVSREETARFIEYRMGSSCLFGDMKFVYPANDEIFNRFAMTDDALQAFRKRELELLFRDKKYVKRDFIQRTIRNIARSLGNPFVLGYHRDTAQSRHVTVYLDGSLVWAHSQHPDQFLGENECCSYGSLWNLDKKPLIPPLAVSELFAQRCAACPVLAFGDRGCACMLQYGKKYMDYYCATQRARLLPVFARFFFDMTDAFIMNIQPLQGVYNA